MMSNICVAGAFRVSVLGLDSARYPGSTSNAARCLHRDSGLFCPLLSGARRTKESAEELQRDLMKVHLLHQP